MKTSNKIILGIVIGPLLILTLVNVALYGKYKSGNYVAMKTVEEERFMYIPLGNISKFALYGLSNVRMVPSDTLRLKIEKEADSHLHYAVMGDSLVIHGDSAVGGPGTDNGTVRSNQQVTLYLPSSASIFADNSEISVQGSKDSVSARSYQFSIIDSRLSTEENVYGDSVQVYFKAINIRADQASTIELTDHCIISHLQLNLFGSLFNDNGAAIGKLELDADKKSTVTLKGDNLKKKQGLSF